MKKRPLLTCSFLLVAALDLSAQSTQTRRADIRGGGGGDSGKCTIEVEVDGTAEVEIRGDMGRLRTLAGQPAVWKRFECNSAMPRNPGDFRFQGVDGRGNQSLVSDPRNGGPVVIRIDDPKGGREGYTFDIEWRGGTGGNWGNNTGVWDRGNESRGTSGYGNYNRDDMLRTCEDAVRSRARSQYNLRDIDLRSAEGYDNRGNRDEITGTFTPRGYGNGEQYRYTCSVNFNNGRVRDVAIERLGAAGGGVFNNGGQWNSGQAVRDCESAVVARLEQDGYRNVRVRDTRVDDRAGRRDRVIGRVTGQMRGSGRNDFEFGCSVDLNSGRVRNVEVNRY